MAEIASDLAQKIRRPPAEGLQGFSGRFPPGQHCWVTRYMNDKYWIHSLKIFFNAWKITQFQMKKFLVFFGGSPFHRIRNWIQEFSNLRKQIVSDQLLVHRSIGICHDENCKFWLRNSKIAKITTSFVSISFRLMNVNKRRKRLRE